MFAAQVHLVERIPWHEALYFVTTTLTTGAPCVPALSAACNTSNVKNTFSNVPSTFYSRLQSILCLNKAAETGH